MKQWFFLPETVPVQKPVAKPPYFAMVPPPWQAM
jgi:hypothetical protein